MGTPRDVDSRADPFVPGQSVDGRYRILRRLSSGGVGVVYEAEHTFTGLRVALKALHNRAGDHPERMQAEARTLAELRHPNIVQVTDGGVTDGVVWFTMELLQGSTLRERLHRGEVLGVERALRFGIQIADAVAFAHEQDVIHRDLKPENVFVLKDDTVKVLDFGTSKITNKLRRSGALKTTDRFRLIGTQAYMPPERLKAERADARADIYALGHILYEMIAGRHCWSEGPGPLDLPDPIELGMRQIYAPPTPLSELVPGLPPDVDRLVLRALAKDPRHRQQTMRELAAELRSALSQCRGAAEIARPPRPASPPGLAREPEPCATTTEQTELPFGAPHAPLTSAVRIAAGLDAALTCGAARFARSSPELDGVEQGLRAIAAARGDPTMCRELALASAEGDDRSRAPLRAAVARIGTAPAGERARLIERLRTLLAQRARPAGLAPSHGDVALGAALLLDPSHRLDAAETALFKLGAADADVQSFALSILVAFGRTPVSMHPAPRGALLALLLGSPEDSELARSELAAFVLSAASLEEAAPAAPAPQGPTPAVTPSPAPRSAPPPAPSSPTERASGDQYRPATPRSAPPPAPASPGEPRMGQRLAPSRSAPPPAQADGGTARPEAPVRMSVVIAIAAGCASVVLAAGAALRAQKSWRAALSAPPPLAAPAPAGTVGPVASQEGAPAVAPSVPNPPEDAATASVAQPLPPPTPSVSPTTPAPRALPSPSGPPSTTPRPGRRGAPGPKLPGSGL